MHWAVNQGLFPTPAPPPPERLRAETLLAGSERRACALPRPRLLLPEAAVSVHVSEVRGERGSVTARSGRENWLR